VLFYGLKAGLKFIVSAFSIKVLLFPSEDKSRHKEPLSPFHPLISPLKMQDITLPLFCRKYKRSQKLLHMYVTNPVVVLSYRSHREFV